MTSRSSNRRLLDRLERFYDAVPRSGADVVDHGPFSLFISRSHWSYYARPRLGFSGTITPDDVASMRLRQRELQVPESFEWVVETTPSLAAAIRTVVLPVEEVPLLVLGKHRPAPVPVGYRVRRVDADEPDLQRVLAVAAVAFANRGTATGDAGVTARDKHAADDTKDHASLRQRLADRTTVMYVIEGDEGPIASSGHQAVEGVAEIVGVATLPAARRRGLAAAVTSAVIGDALESGIDVIFLGAASDDVARVYERLGFERVGHAGLAEPAASAHPQ